MDTDLAERALNIINTVPYLTLATTSKEYQPWNTPLGFVYDDTLDFFWFSAKDTQHSQNIRHNEKVFLVIYDSTVPAEAGEGVFIEAVAHELSSPEDIRHARRLTHGADSDALEKFSGDSERRAYRARPLHIWVNGARDSSPDTWRDTRFTVDKTQLQALLKEEERHEPRD